MNRKDEQSNLSKADGNSSKRKLGDRLGEWKSTEAMRDERAHGEAVQRTKMEVYILEADSAEL